MQFIDTAKVKIYIGMTNDPDRRYNEHKNSKRFNNRTINLFVLITGLTKPGARVIEQVLIDAFTLKALENLINSIASKNRNEDLIKRVGDGLIASVKRLILIAMAPGHFSFGSYKIFG